MKQLKVMNSVRFEFEFPSYTYLHIAAQMARLSLEEMKQGHFHTPSFDLNKII